MPSRIKDLTRIFISIIKGLIKKFMRATIKDLIKKFIRQGIRRARLNSARLNSALRSWAKILPYRPQVCQVKIAKFHKKKFFIWAPKMINPFMKIGANIYVKKIKDVIS